MTDEPDSTPKKNNVISLFGDAAKNTKETAPEEPENSFLAFLLHVTSDLDFSHLENLPDFLDKLKVDLNLDHAGLVQQFGPEFSKAAGPMTGIYIPLSIAVPYNMWTMIVAEYQDLMQEIDPSRYARISKMLTRKPDRNSHINYYADHPQIDRETTLFSHHLMVGLKPYRMVQAQLLRDLPELEIRPALRVVGEQAQLSAYVRCKDLENSPDIRDIISDYVSRSQKGRAHLRVVKNDPAP